MSIRAESLFTISEWKNFLTQSAVLWEHLLVHLLFNMTDEHLHDANTEMELPGDYNGLFFKEEKVF